MKSNNIIILLSCIVGLVWIFPEHVFSQVKHPVALNRLVKIKKKNALENLKKKMGEDFDVYWHSGNKRVKTLRGKLSLPHPGTPEVAARQFLKENTAIFQLEPGLDDIELESVKESLGGNHIRFIQVFATLTIFNGTLDITLKKDKSVFIVHNNYLPDINIPTSPTLSESEVAIQAQNHFLQNYRYPRNKNEEARFYTGGGLIFETEPKIQLGILEYKEKPYLAYRIILHLSSPIALMEYVIDAHTGDVLKWRNLIQNFDGTGKTFDPNPVNTLNDTTLIDNRDKDD
jgi:Zn-dependent metalloprotease